MPGDPQGRAGRDQTATWTQISSGDRWVPTPASTGVLRRVPGWMDSSWGHLPPSAGLARRGGQGRPVGEEVAWQGPPATGCLVVLLLNPHASTALTVTRSPCCAAHGLSVLRVGAFVASTRLVLSAVWSRLGTSGPFTRCHHRCVWGDVPRLTVGFGAACPFGVLSSPFLLLDVLFIPFALSWRPGRPLVLPSTVSPRLRVPP